MSLIRTNKGSKVCGAPYKKYNGKVIEKDAAYCKNRSDWNGEQRKYFDDAKFEF